MAWPARLTLLALGLICLTPIAALMALGANAPGSDMASLLSDPVILRALRFTLLQAGLSTLLSVIVALPVLYALRAMRPGYVTGALRSLFALPLVLPQIVAALAIVGVYGQAGWVADSADFMGLGWPSIYGLPGVVLAHVFFNMPLIVRVLDQALDVVPAEYRKTAAQIGMGPLAQFRLIDWPAMAPAMRGGAALVFLLCATSFTIVLVLGGGPRSTTLEVAIYQALTFDFDVRRAVVLVLMQVALGATVVFALSPSRIMDHGPMGVMGANPRFGGDDASSRMKFPTYFVVFAAGVFVGAPFLFVVIDGLSGDLTGVVSGSAFLRAASTSAAIGVCSAVLACAGAIAMSATAVVPRRRKTGNGGGLVR
ncbi:MAG: ABC transporter permease subunit, partial [Pseudomonadota bacterium]